MYKRETELRHLQPNDAYKLGVILDDNNCWKKLMEVIPKEINTQASSADGQLNWEQVAAAGLKYSNDHIRLIENSIKRPGESRLFSQILFEEWGTSGRKHERPTVGVLLQLLVKAELFRAADYVAVNFLSESPPERPLNGPAAKIDISLDSEIFNDIEEFANDSSYYPGTETLIDNANYANSVGDHNKDFYTKYQRVDKLMGIAEENIIAPPKPPPRTLRNTRLQQSQMQQQQLIATGNDVSTAEAINRSATNAQSQAQPTQVQSMQQAEQQLYDGTHESNNLLTSQNIPILSALRTNTSYSTTNHAQSEDDENTALSQNTESTNLSEAPIPLVSMLAGTSTNAAVTTKNDTDEIIQVEMQQSTGILTTDSDNLPVISALNLNGERGVSEKSERKLLNDINIATSASKLPSPSLSLLQASISLSNHSERSHSRSSSLSNDSIDEDIELPADIVTNINHQYINGGVGDVANCIDANATCNIYNHDSVGVDEDDDDNSIPNLSVFEQRSSNNDSSLTTVTGTSGENSFELSMNDCSSASNENIPCLSALKQ